MLERRLTALVLALSCLGPASAGADEKAIVRVLAGDELGPVNRLVLGHNLEAADSVNIFTEHSNPIPGRTGDGVWDPSNPPGRPVAFTVATARAIGMGALRYPGGCLTHSFDWKGAVGPLAGRPDYTFGVDELLVYCREVGAEPVITVSAYIGGPSEAAELVEYLNAPSTPDHPWAMQRAANGHEAPWRVRYFETLFLIVINKHHQEAVPTVVEVDGVIIRSISSWSVTGPALESTNLVAPLVGETVTGEAVPQSSQHGFEYAFPPRSMTAFEVHCLPERRPVRRVGRRASRP
jgi:hypothetical protein